MLAITSDIYKFINFVQTHIKGAQGHSRNKKVYTKKDQKGPKNTQRKKSQIQRCLHQKSTKKIFHTTNWQTSRFATQNIMILISFGKKIHQSRVHWEEKTMASLKE